MAFRWSRRGSLTDSSHYSEKFTDHKVAGIALRWSMRWRKVGYVYMFRHRVLEVQLADADVAARVHDTWQQVFGQPPVLTARRPEPES